MRGRAHAPPFVLTYAFGEPTPAASGSGAKRQSRPKCRVGNEVEASSGVGEATAGGPSVEDGRAETGFFLGDGLSARCWVVARWTVDGVRVG
jgi:hypothetical protein